MSTLVDSFLNDLEEDERDLLSNPEKFLNQQKNRNFDELNNLTKLLHNPEFKQFIEKLGKTEEDEDEYDHEYDEILVQCNEYVVEIDTYIERLHNFCVRLYRKKFPGLEEQIKNPLTYSKVVMRIKNKKNIDNVDFTDILSNKTILVIRLTFSNCGGENISNEEFSFVEKSIKTVLELSNSKEKMLKYVSSKMKNVAPNLSAIVGTTIAAQLIGMAGGLEKLSKLPASTILLLGRDRKNLHGMSSSTIKDRFCGVIGKCDIVLNTPSDFRKKASRVIANKSVLAIRADVFCNDNDAVGRKLRQKILKVLEKRQEPPPPIQEKPLPVPDEYRRRTKRGGKNERRKKQIYGMTEARKKKNRISFGTQQLEDLRTGETYGLLGVETGNNSLRIQPKTKIKIKKQLKGYQTSFKSKTPFYGGKMDGLSSSLVFTPVQGIELSNPSNLVQDRKRKAKKYFDTFEFKKPKKKKRKIDPNLKNILK